MLFVENMDSLPPLHLAAYQGDVQAIDALINGGVSVDERTDTAGDYGTLFHQLTPLMVAAGSLESTAAAVQLLLTLGADPQAKSERGTSAIWYAASIDVERFQLLLAAGADPHESISNGRNVLCEAAEAGKSDIIKTLLALGVSPHPAPVTFTREAFLKEHLGAENTIVDLFQPREGNSESGGFQIPLFLASQSGDAASVQLLLQAGASPLLRDYDGRTALFYAASPVVVSLLLGVGCPLNTIDNYESSELDSALDNHRAEVVRALIAAGAWLTSQEHRVNPLVRHCMSFEVDAAMVQLLIDLGADPHERVYGQRTALHQAVKLIAADRRGKLGDVVRVLVKAGIPVDARDEYGWTPLHQSVGEEGTDLDAVDALLDLGADINATDGRGQTPLMATILRGWRPVESVALLLQRGADPHIQQSDGQTARDYAVSKVESWQRIMADPEGVLGTHKSTPESHSAALTTAKTVLALIDAALQK